MIALAMQARVKMMGMGRTDLRCRASKEANTIVDSKARL